MKKEAIQHFNTEEYIYPVKRNELVFKIRCAKKDISKCILVYWDRTKPENQKKQELKCCYREGLFDYFQMVEKHTNLIHENLVKMRQNIILN